MEMENNSVLPHNVLYNRGLLNVFTVTAAIPQQAHDHLKFRKIGSEDLVQFITYHILRKPSTDAPINGTP